MDAAQDMAALLGDRLRRARDEGRWRQAEVAERAGLSQATISRMELGAGGSITLDTWSDVAAATGVRFIADLRSDAGRESAWPASAWPAMAATAARRCHALIEDEARGGGWTAVTEIAGDVIETALVRPVRGEVAIIRVWDALASVDAAARDFLRAIERERDLRAASIDVGGLAVVLYTAGNRRRVAESRPILREVVPASGARWVSALRHPRLPMPREPGLIWASPDGSRIRPTPHRPGWQ
jgi:transcriptional regulator with XRE-family HTH domain